MHATVLLTGPEAVGIIRDVVVVAFLVFAFLALAVFVVLALLFYRRLAALFVLNGVFIFLALTPYRPPFVPYVTAVLVTIWLIRRAKRLPHPRYELPERPSARPWRFFALGFWGTLGLFFVSWGLPTLNVPVFFTWALLIGRPFGVRWGLLKLMGRGQGWPFGHQWRWRQARSASSSC